MGMLDWLPGDSEKHVYGAMDKVKGFLSNKAGRPGTRKTKAQPAAPAAKRGPQRPPKSRGTQKTNRPKAQASAPNLIKFVDQQGQKKFGQQWNAPAKSRRSIHSGNQTRVARPTASSSTPVSPGVMNRPQPTVAPTEVPRQQAAFNPSFHGRFTNYGEFNSAPDFNVNSGALNYQPGNISYTDAAIMPGNKFTDAKDFAIAKDVQMNRMQPNQPSYDMSGKMGVQSGDIQMVKANITDPKSYTEAKQYAVARQAPRNEVYFPNETARQSIIGQKIQKAMSSLSGAPSERMLNDIQVGAPHSANPTQKATTQEKASAVVDKYNNAYKAKQAGQAVQKATQTGPGMGATDFNPFAQQRPGVQSNFSIQNQLNMKQTQTSSAMEQTQQSQAFADKVKDVHRKQFPLWQEPGQGFSGMLNRDDSERFGRMIR